MTHLKDEGKACDVSVSGATPDGTQADGRSTPPPLDIEAVRRARHAVSQTSSMVPMQYLVDLLGAYDQLAARFAWMAANAAEDQS